MNTKLNGKIALITGSTAGIGLAIAKALHGEGANVIINGRTQERVDEALRQLSTQEGGHPRGIAADLSTLEGVSRITREFSHVDILVNNFGVYESKAARDLEDGDWLRLFELNVLSGARLSQAYLPKMRARNWGRVLFIASEAGVNIPPDMIPYGVSKAAQIALSRGLAETTAGSEVTVNSVLPGPTYSEGVSRFLETVPDLKAGSRSEVESTFIKKLRPTSLIQRFATGEEVASLVTYLASPLASATNGAAVRVEGGLLRGTL
jgi:NAD(P)-dependent dehydrogenase (short-subunit alcohol dehydrogenase family)